MKTTLDRAASRGVNELGWLKTRYTFSFADYFNPQRTHFGKLRVLNDDAIAPGRGFGMHEHRNMEVITIPLHGQLRHGDSLEHSEVISPGDIQVMSAGTGVFHSEYNESRDQWLELLQIWVFPKDKETKPRYHNYDIRSTLTPGELTPIIAPDGSAPAKIRQDAWFSIGQIPENKVIEYHFHAPQMGAYLFVIEGEAEIPAPGEVITLHRRDGIGISQTDAFQLKTTKNSHLLLIEVPMN